MNDQTIWGNIVKDDVDALRLLHDKYYHSMWLWASKFIQDDKTSEELVSDCFIKLWSHRKNIVIERSVKSYIYLMLRNSLVSHVRSSRKQFMVDSDQVPDVPDEETINTLDFYADLYRAISKIPEQRRRILELAVFESLTYREISSQLNISINTVKTQMGRAYQFLKKELDPDHFILLHIVGPRVL
jgi:RNA polymerase sigma-70 factor (ECF subfamily)